MLSLSLVYCQILTNVVEIMNSGVVQPQKLNSGQAFRTEQPCLYWEEVVMEGTQCVSLGDLFLHSSLRSV